jgi:hypothetical protein
MAFAPRLYCTSRGKGRGARDRRAARLGGGARRLVSIVVAISRDVLHDVPSHSGVGYTHQLGIPKSTASISCLASAAMPFLQP